MVRRFDEHIEELAGTAARGTLFSGGSSQRLEISADKCKGQSCGEQRVSSSDCPHCRQAHDGVERIARQGRFRPPAGVRFIGSPRGRHRPNPQDEIPDSDCPHEKEGGAGRGFVTGDPHHSTRCGDESETHRGAEPPHRTRINRRHSVAHWSLRRPTPKRRPEGHRALSDRSFQETQVPRRPTRTPDRKIVLYSSPIFDHPVGVTLVTPSSPPPGDTHRSVETEYPVRDSSDLLIALEQDDVHSHVVLPERNVIRATRIMRMRRCPPPSLLVLH